MIHLISVFFLFVVTLVRMCEACYFPTCERCRAAEGTRSFFVRLFGAAVQTRCEKARKSGSDPAEMSESDCQEPAAALNDSGSTTDRPPRPSVGNRVTVVLGAQWGDEGKGKVVDLLAQDADMVCRCQVG